MNPLWIWVAAYFGICSVLFGTRGHRKETSALRKSVPFQTLDIYNTFQPEVYDIVDFKERFGKQITFYGGISTQRLLPFKTPPEVKAEMHRIMDILGKDGGYILAPTHAMPNDIPIENVFAFLDVARNENPK